MTSLADVVALIGLVLVVTGTAFLLVAAVGVVRLPDVYARQHAAGKAATLGVASCLLGAAAILGNTASTLKLLAAVAFQLIAAPIATHALSRAAYRAGNPMWDRTAVDELAEAYARGDLAALPEDELDLPPSG